MERRTLPVLDSTMAFLEAGSGPTVVLLHGNPTSSHLWRNVIPGVAEAGYRVIAADLIGMGRSGSSGRGYRLVDHLAYLEAFLDALGVPDPVLVGHDWGGVLALALARSRPASVRGAAVLEAHLHPIDDWSDLSEADSEMFSRLRAQGSGEQAVIEDNFFVEVVLPAGVVRDLAASDHDGYRAPFTDAAARAPILQWVREIPSPANPPMSWTWSRAIRTRCGIRDSPRWSSTVTPAR
ncbi:Pimeloyl-ACP methyl ester carboxylesterase [Rathayibacter oskolensis]|uniref:Pimeloyl-ACP methyl ester carboxylesterase n=1 Tax=Rathayibacter oskolensis TaxID=1891671 RepID=A0A1X7MXQ9_9MICO|nr:haloalkane dehalogenase [Rathayibacter oskolensis]SMH29683.1 Pimeloyl-ACP methyl ester carboxylesterase [Rathayibacter oskolensis]